MAHDLRISDAARNAAMNAVTALLNAGGAGTIAVYDGTRPAGPGTGVTTQVLLVTLTFAADAFGDAAAGVSTAAAIGSGTAVAAGIATWYRLRDGSGTAVIDGTAGAADADLILATTSVAVGNVVECTAFTLTHPA